MKELILTIKNVYGNEMVYPVCDASKLMAKLVEKKTLSNAHLAILKSLGYTMKYVLTDASGKERGSEKI